MPGNANAILGVSLSENPRLIWCDFPLWELFQCLAGLLRWRLENRSNLGMTSCTSGSINTGGLAFSNTVKELGPLGPPALKMLKFEVACWDGQVYLLLGQGSQGRVWSRTSQLLSWVVSPHLPFPCFSSLNVLITGRVQVNEALEK